MKENSIWLRGMQEQNHRYDRNVDMYLFLHDFVHS